VVVDAVAARLAANWTATAIIDDDTTGQGTGDGSAYVTVEYPVAIENQITVDLREITSSERRAHSGSSWFPRPV